MKYADTKLLHNIGLRVTEAQYQWLSARRGDWGSRADVLRKILEREMAQPFGRRVKQSVPR